MSGHIIKVTSIVLTAYVRGQTKRTLYPITPSRRSAHVFASKAEAEACVAHLHSILPSVNPSRKLEIVVVPV